MSKKASANYIFMCVLMLSPMVGAGVDIFAPALPQVAHQFGTDAVKMSIGIYILAYGVAQFFAGPFSDSLGHKKLMLGGLLGYVICALLAAYSTNLTELLIFRALQGIAIAAPVVIVRAIPAVIFDKKLLPVKINYITMAWAIGPVVAPFIGGYLTHFISWHATLIFLALYAFVVFVLYLRVHETIKHKHPLEFGVHLKAYKDMMIHPGFLGAFVCTCLMYGMILMFNVVGPFLIQSEMGYTPVDFGYVALFLGLAILFGNLLNRFLMTKFSRFFSMNFTLIVGLIASIAMLLIAMHGILNLYVIAIPTFSLFLACGMTFGNVYSLPLQLFPEHPGKASALFGTLFVTGAGIITSLSSLLKTHNQIALSTVNLVIIILVVIFYFATVRPALKKI